MHGFNIVFFFFVSVAARTLKDIIQSDFERIDTCKIKNSKVKIYFHKDRFNCLPDDTTLCSNQCELVPVQEDADLVLWHVATDQFPGRTNPDQIVAGISLEGHNFLNASQTKDADFTINFLYDADITYTYIEEFFYKEIEKAIIPTEEEFNNMETALFIQSNCVKFRKDFVSNLMMHTNITSRGVCLNNAPRLTGHWTKIASAVKNKYKFYIAIENRLRDDYFTEKFTNGFLANSIPVYFGPKNTDDFMNENSYIRIKSLDDFKSVAEQINRLSGNYTEWRAMFEKRKLPFKDHVQVKRWVEYTKYASGRRDRGNLCRICDYACDKYF